MVLFGFNALAFAISAPLWAALSRARPRMHRKNHFSEKQFQHVSTQTYKLRQAFLVSQGSIDHQGYLEPRKVMALCLMSSTRLDMDL